MSDQESPPAAKIDSISETSSATGWQQMADMVHKVDKKDIDDRKEDIDTLLVFAGLFSAVLTAFLIEIYTMLQPDPTSEMTFLLRQSLSQNYTFNAGYLNSTSPFPQSPPFVAPKWAVYANAFWFAGLICSLGAASAAILVKQWMREYLAMEWTAPQERLRARQYRNEGLKTWKVAEISAALPLLLQASLGLFFLGLCFFTASIDDRIGRSTIPLVLGWAFFFAVTTLAPVLSPHCPYKAPFVNGIFNASRNVTGYFLVACKSLFHQCWDLLKHYTLSDIAFDLWDIRDDFDRLLVQLAKAARMLAQKFYQRQMQSRSWVRLLISSCVMMVVIGPVLLAWCILIGLCAVIGLIFRIVESLADLLDRLSESESSRYIFKMTNRAIHHITFNIVHSPYVTFSAILRETLCDISSAAGAMRVPGRFHMMPRLPHSTLHKIQIDNRTESIAVKEDQGDIKLLLEIDKTMANDSFLQPMWDLLHYQASTPSAYLDFVFALLKHRMGTTAGFPDSVRDIWRPMDLTPISHAVWDIVNRAVIEAFKQQHSQIRSEAIDSQSYETSWAKAGLAILSSKSRFPQPSSTVSFFSDIFSRYQMTTHELSGSSRNIQWSHTSMYVAILLYFPLPGVNVKINSPPKSLWQQLQIRRSNISELEQHALLLVICQDLTLWMSHSSQLDEEGKTTVCEVGLIFLALLNNATPAKILQAFGLVFKEMIETLHTFFTSKSIKHLSSDASDFKVSSQLFLLLDSSSESARGDALHAALAFYTILCDQIGGQSMTYALNTFWDDAHEAHRQKAFGNPATTLILADASAYLWLVASKPALLETSAPSFLKLFTRACMAFMQPITPYNAFAGSHPSNPWLVLIPILRTFQSKIRDDSSSFDETEMASDAEHALKRIVWSIDKFPREFLKIALSFIPEGWPLDNFVSAALRYAEDHIWNTESSDEHGSTDADASGQEQRSASTAHIVESAPHANSHDEDVRFSFCGSIEDVEEDERLQVESDGHTYLVAEPRKVAPVLETTQTNSYGDNNGITEHERPSSRGFAPPPSADDERTTETVDGPLSAPHAQSFRNSSVPASVQEEAGGNGLSAPMTVADASKAVSTSPATETHDVCGIEDVASGTTDKGDEGGENDVLLVTQERDLPATFEGTPQVLENARVEGDAVDQKTESPAAPTTETGSTDVR